MLLGYIGNFIPPHSTENDIQSALTNLGHEVLTFQENDPRTWHTIELLELDVMFWTRTGWHWPDYQITANYAHQLQTSMLVAARHAHVPTVGLHLDRWIGLAREPEIDSEPFFKCEWMFTADGGHDQQWQDHGVNHHWFPPAVNEQSCYLSKPRGDFASDIAFVGSWNSYHPEWTHRFELVEHLRRSWGSRVEFWPKGPAIRGGDLNDLYSSVTVLVGDSCLIDDATHYCSDRIPETLGRGGLLIHPHVRGITDGTLWTGEDHLLTWTLGKWDELDRAIDWALSNPLDARNIALMGMAHTLARHTYDRRLEAVLDVIAGRRQSVV